MIFISACCSLVISTFSWIQKQRTEAQDIKWWNFYDKIGGFEKKKCKCKPLRLSGKVVITFDSLVVEVTCLLSVLSAPSVSSPVDWPGEALVFFRSLLDLHWISVSRPVSSDEGFTMCVNYLTALYSTGIPHTNRCSFHWSRGCIRIVSNT